MDGGTKGKGGGTTNRVDARDWTVKIVNDGVMCCMYVRQKGSPLQGRIKKAG